MSDAGVRSLELLDILYTSSHSRPVFQQRQSHRGDDHLTLDNIYRDARSLQRYVARAKCYRSDRDRGDTSESGAYKSGNRL